MLHKILIITTVPQSIDTFCKGRLKMLSKYFNVVAVSSPGEKLDLVRNRENVRTVAIPMERHISLVKDLVSLFHMIILFQKEKPQIVHSMTPKAGLISMLAAWVTKVPIRMHTYTGLVFPTTTGIKQKILILTDKILCFCANYINPEGLGVKNDLKRFHITQKPLHIIANGNVRGVDMTYYNRTAQVTIESRKYIQNDTFTFCFVGRLVKDKGINELISAFTKLQNSFQNIRLILVGSYEKKLDPISPVSEDIIDHNKNILYVGSQENVRPFLAASDAFVFPSYREGFPNVLLEAGALGLPCIVTDINGSNEIIIPNQNGIIIPSHDENALYNAMKYFANNPEKAKMMGKNARPLIESRYEQKMIWDALLKEYQQLCSEKGII